MSERKAIRNGIVTRLSGNTSAGTNVHNSRVIPKAPGALPAINVYFLSEEYERRDAAGLMYTARPTLSIECIVGTTSTTTAEDDLDDLLDKVQSVLFQDPTFFPLIGKVNSMGTAFSFDKEGQETFGFGLFTMELEHELTFEPTVTDAFTRVNTKVDMIDPHDSNLGTSGPDGTIDAEFNADPEQ